MLLLWIAVLLQSGCGATRHLGKDEVLVKTTPTFARAEPAKADTSGKKSIWAQIGLKPEGVTSLDPGILASSVKTQPNRRMLFPKTYLHFYMMGKSLQEPLSKIAPPTRTGRDFNGKFFNDLRVISSSDDQVLAFIKYIDTYYFPSRPLLDSLGSFLELTAGEQPHLVDTAVLNNDVSNLETVYFSRGYFYAKGAYQIDTCTWRINEQKARIQYLINEGPAAMIGAYQVDSSGVPNPEMLAALRANSDGAKLRPGDLYNENNFSAERGRILQLMRTSGFYTFAPNLITFEVDTVPDTNLVAGVKPNNFKVREHYPIAVRLRIRDGAEHYRIRKISMRIEPADFATELDTMVTLNGETINDSVRNALGLHERLFSADNRIEFLSYRQVLEKLNLDFLEELVAYRKGQLYSLDNERKTQRRLQGLGIFKYVLVKHEVDQANRVVDVRIEAQLLRRYQLKAGVEGFSENDPLISQNLPGVGAELAFRDLMVFNGAERLDLSLATNLAFFRTGSSDTLSTFIEGSGNLSFRVPRFLIPFKSLFSMWDLQSLQPVTTFGATFSREDTRAYTRNSTTLDWTYTWFHGALRQNSQSALSPFVLSFVDSDLDPRFVREIIELEDTELRNLFILDFTPRFNSWSRYKYTLSNYQSSKVKATGYLQPILEIGGNVPYLIDRLYNLGRADQEVRILGARDRGFRDSKLGNVQYGQYMKVSAEAKGNFPIDRNSSFVLRGLVGVANPWNYAPFVPQASRFFAGGTNGMRGWLSNTLGPGTYRPALDDSTAAGFANILTVGGEVILMANAELRANVYKFVELAIFSDIGNVWFLPNSDVDFPGAKLSKNNYLELGWDFGIGLRMDFDFFIFRLDLAQQIYAPDLGDFVVKSFPRDLGADRFQLNFGIGYPF